jgi:hypothetical protein
MQNPAASEREHLDVEQQRSEGLRTQRAVVARQPVSKFLQPTSATREVRSLPQRQAYGGPQDLLEDDKHRSSHLREYLHLDMQAGLAPRMAQFSL